MNFTRRCATDDGASLLADTLGAGRDDRALGALVLELHGKLQAQPYMDRWLASQEQLWHDLPSRVEDTVYGTLLLSMVRRKALHCAALLRGAAEEMTSDAALADKYAPLFLGVAEQFALLAASAEEDWDAAAKRRVDFPRLTAVRKCGDEALKAKMQGVWNGCKKTAKGFDEVFSVTSAEAMEDLRAMAPAMLALLKLTADFSRAYQEEKRRRNAADFSDQEHEAIDLLLGTDGQPTDLARTVSQRYREIMVDEYQDTNEVQNCIFSAISREGKNLFTVGDVKQSIYRFRLADPRIFLDHYLRYPHAADAAEGESAKLLLSKNFRSRNTVLDAANFVFRNVLSREMGELDYGEDESLHVGASYPENPDCCTEFHFVEMSAQESDTEKLRATRAEASFAADYVQRLIAGGFTVQDDKTHEPRSGAGGGHRHPHALAPHTACRLSPRAGEPRAALCRRERRRLLRDDGGRRDLRAARNIGQPAAGRAAHLCAALAAFRLHAGPSRRAARENAGRRFLRCTRRGRGRGLPHGSSRCCASCVKARRRSRSPSWSRRSMSAAISRRCSARCGEEPHAGKIFVRSSRWRRNLSAAAGGGSSPLSGICASSWNPASRPCRRPRTPRRACAS